MRPTHHLTSAVRGVVRRIVRVFTSGRRIQALEADLTAARRELRDARKELKSTRKALKKARVGAGEDSSTGKLPTVSLPPEVSTAIRQAREERLTFLKENNLRELAAVVSSLDTDEIPGLIIEAGTARGGSAIVIATAKSPARPMKVYDVFGLIPEPTDKDGADVHDRYRTIAAGEAQGQSGDTYYGYRDDLYGEVTDSFSRLGVPTAENNVELVKGLFQDTIEIDGPVAFAHLDGDWYESTMTCLERIAPALVSGGRIVLDDYYSWSGCRTAVDEYFADHPGFHFEQHAKLHVVRD